MRKHFMKKVWLLAIAMFMCVAVLQAQTNKKTDLKKSIELKKESLREKEHEREGIKEGEEGESEDMAYEIKHKSSKWYKEMNKPHADYFFVKKNYERYFAKHKWEGSQCRETGQGWLMSKINYLDKKGFVQDAPPFDPSSAPSPVAPTAGITTRDVGSWHMIGPVNTKFVPSSAPGNLGGYVNMNRIDPTNPLKMFTSFQFGGLWMTSDGGTSWTLTDANLPDYNYNDLDVCISNPLVVYAISASGVVIKSTDGGLSWALTSLTGANYPGQSFYDIAVSPTNPNVVVARVGTTIYRTADGGTIWTPIVTGLPDYPVQDGNKSSEMVDWSTTDSNVVYFLSFDFNSVNHDLQVYRSGDAGLTFSVMTSVTLDAALTNQGIGWAKLMLPSNNATAMYIAVGSGELGGGYGQLPGPVVSLYKLNNTTGAEILRRVSIQSGNSMDYGDIAMDRNNENLIVFCGYGGGFPLFSIDNGITFTAASTPIHPDTRSIDIVSNHVLDGNDGQSTLSTDGGITYTGITNTISNHELWGFSAAFKSDVMSVGCNHGPVMMSDPGNPTYEWFNGKGADACNANINPLDDRYMYNHWGYGISKFFRDAPQHLQELPIGIDVGIFTYFNNVEFHPNLYYSLITYSSGSPDLLRSDDNAATFTTIHTFTDQVARNKIYLLNPNIMYVLAGESNGHLWKTTNGGTTWTDVTPSSAASSGETNISDIALSDVDPNMVWVTYSSVQNVCKVLKTTNGGTSWTNLTTATLTTNPITKMVYQRGSNGGIYVGTDAGVFYRNNTMADWSLIGNLVNCNVRNMFINYNLGKLKIGTSRGAWEHDLYETNAPKAQISASSNKFTCASGPIQFKDYSTVRNASATWAWSFPGGTPSTSTDENPLVNYANASDGFKNVSLTVTDAYGTSSQTLTNFIQVSSAGIPSTFVENFEGTFPSSNFTSAVTWTNNLTPNIGGFGLSNGSTQYENYYTDAPASLQTKAINLGSPGLTAAYLTFDIAYSNVTAPDSLTIYVSNDCGSTFTQIYQKGGTDLSTAPDCGCYFVPAATDWRKDSINLGAYIGNKVIFKIEASGHGQGNFYLDNLNVNQVILPLTTITTSPITPTSYCAGEMVNVPFTVNGIANPGNVFTAQISSRTGSFSSPVNIGTLNSINGGTISGIIPGKKQDGTQYRIRVVGSNPPVTGSNNGSDISLNHIPAKPGFISGSNLVCIRQSAVPYSISPVASAATYTWRGPPKSHISDGVTTSVGNVLTTAANAITVNFGTSTGEISVKAINSCGSSGKIILNVGFNCRENEQLLVNHFDVTCYPIPATNELNISFSSDKEQSGSIRISEMSGKTLLHQNFPSTIGENNFTFDISHIAKGIYLLEVVNGSEKSVQKIAVE